MTRSSSGFSGGDSESARPYDRRHLGYLIAAFALSRLLYFALGMRFDTHCLTCYSQFIDPYLLRTDLLRSVFYQHTQPPLFNFFVGVILQIFPNIYAIVFQALWMCMGLAAGITLYTLMLAMKVAPRVAIIFSCLFLSSPSYALYEAQLFYDFPLLVFFTFAAYTLWHYLATGALRSGILFFSLLTVIAYSRSVYHPIWIIVITGIAMWMGRGSRRRTAILGATALLLVLGLFVKNALVFGEFNASTWMGVNLHNPTVQQITFTDRRELIKEGVLTNYALVDNPIAELDSFRRYYNIPASKTGIPALDEEFNVDGGLVNANNSNYIPIYHEYLRNSLAFIRERPKVYVTSVLRGAGLFLAPTDKPWEFDANRARIEIPDRIFNTACYGQFVYVLDDKTSPPRGSAGWILRDIFGWGLGLIFGIPLLVVFSSIRLYKRIRRKEITSAEAGVLLFILISLVYTGVLSSLLTVAENSRYRFPFDGFIWMLLGLWLTEAWPKYRAKYRKWKERSHEKSVTCGT